MVERLIMSIINKMHQELQDHHENSPILSVMPEKKHPKSGLLFCLISFLLVTSIGLSYLIYAKENGVSKAVQINANQPQQALQQPVEKVVATEIITEIIAEHETAGVVAVDVVSASTTSEVIPMDVTARTVAEISPEAVPVLSENDAIEVAEKPNSTVKVPTIKTPEVAPFVSLPIPTQTALKAQPKKRLNVVPTEDISHPHLEIKKSVLTAAQLAAIHLKNADKALQKGDTPVAAIEKNKALYLQPQLHEVRQSLALYYYSIGEQQRATSLLKKGALQFPEFADFNLMLARIALKNEEPQRAYLYLQQHPPTVQGNLDYHVSYAILAQKFKQYEQAESLYLGLLTQRPNNGRWRMSLAIAQDKQGKESLAVASYQKALLQIDLSGNAKKYINQRLTYLANN